MWINCYLASSVVGLMLDKFQVSCSLYELGDGHLFSFFLLSALLDKSMTFDSISGLGSYSFCINLCVAEECWFHPS